MPTCVQSLVKIATVELWAVEREQTNIATNRQMQLTNRLDENIFQHVKEAGIAPPSVDPLLFTHVVCISPNDAAADTVYNEAESNSIYTAHRQTNRQSVSETRRADTGGEEGPDRQPVDTVDLSPAFTLNLWLPHNATTTTARRPQKYLRDRRHVAAIRRTADSQYAPISWLFSWSRIRNNFIRTCDSDHRGPCWQTNRICRVRWSTRRLGKKRKSLFLTITLLSIPEP